jgi:N12 class adenine-specific DNA methylase/SAM-dependent methyltransferase
LKQAFESNIAAITLLKDIQGRPDPTASTPEEKTILAGYRGWGWAGVIFNVNERDSGHAVERNKLHALLSEDEYKQAAASTVSSFYTPDEVIRASWDAVNRLGFNGGTVLDPSAGTGRYEGALPETLRPYTRVTAVEIDAISAAITRTLYPQSEVIHSGFEDAALPRNAFDLAITNVPFANHKVTGSDYTEYNLHDYCIMRATDKVRPGGLLCLLTTRSTLDNQNPQFRRELSEKTDLVAAYRLPSSAFDSEAGAKVVSDLLILRKKDGRAFAGASFSQISLAPITNQVQNENAAYEYYGRGRGNPTLSGSDEAPMARINEYFVAHPENVIGQNAIEKGRYGSPSYTVTPLAGRSIGELLRERMAHLPQAIMGDALGSPAVRVEAALAGEREGTYGIDGENFYQIQNGERRGVDWITTRNFGDGFDKPVSSAEGRARTSVAREWMALRDQAVTLFHLENKVSASEAELTSARATLNTAYDRYVSHHGSLNRPPGKAHLESARFMEDDPEYPLVLALEDEIKKPGQANNVEYVKGRIFHERIRQPTVIPEKAANLEEALNISLGFYQSIHPDRIASLLGITPAEAVVQIESSGRAFLNPETSLYESSEKYLSGNVYLKLKAAKKIAEENPVFQRNVDALSPIQPERIPLGNIYAQIGSRWLPSSVIGAFAGEKFGGRYTVQYSPGLNSYEIRGHGDGKDKTYAVLNGTRVVMEAGEVLTHAANGTDPVIYKPELVKGKWEDVKDPLLSKAASQMVDRLQLEFRSWLLTSDVQLEFEGESKPVAHIVEEIYNRTNNSMVEPKYTGEHIPLVGATSYVHRTAHRMSAVSRIMQEQCAVLAHGVGSGKTLTCIVSVMELKRLGMARHPWIVVQKQTIGQFAREFRRAYPDANILVADEKNFTAKNRQRFLARAATREYDAVIVTQPQFDLVMSSKAAAEAYYTEQIAALGEEEGTGVPYREIEKAKRRLEARLKKMTQAIEKRQDKIMSFEETGADWVFLDEAHAYKRIPIISRLSRVKGIPNTESQRATSTMIKLRSIQSRFNGRHVVTATGTPLTNTMAEAYVMLTLATPNVLKQYKIDNFDAFAHTFGVKASKVEHSWSGQWKMVTRFNRFVNGTELITMIRSGFDVRMGNKELGLKVPNVRGGGPELVIIPPTAAMRQVNQWIHRIADTFEEDTEKREHSWIPITAMQAGVAAALDPRLVQPSLPDDPKSKINVAVAKIAGIYGDTREGKLTQIVFCDRFRPMQTSKLTDYANGRPSDEAVEDLAVEEGADETSSSPEAEEAALIRCEDAEYKGEGFNLYHEIRRKLVTSGVPAAEIAIIHDYNTDVKRTRLFEEINAGTIAILLGSTEKAGIGVNIQERLYAAHHLDPPRMMTPAMVEQRNGRIVRQGNPLDEVRLLYYGMESSMDTGIYQMLESKQVFIVQALMGQSNLREFDDAADEVSISMSEMKARLTGDPRSVRKVELEQVLRQLRSDKLVYDNQVGSRVRYLGQIRSNLTQSEKELVSVQKTIPVLKVFLAEPGFELLIDENKYTSPEAAEVALTGVYRDLKRRDALGDVRNSKTVFLNDLPIGLQAWNGAIAVMLASPVAPDYSVGSGRIKAKDLLPWCREAAKTFVEMRRERVVDEISNARQSIETLEKESVKEWDDVPMQAVEVELDALDTELLAESEKKRGRKSNQSRLDLSDAGAATLLVPASLPVVEPLEGSGLESISR